MTNTVNGPRARTAIIRRRFRTSGLWNIFLDMVTVVTNNLFPLMYVPLGQVPLIDSRSLG